MIDDRVVFGNVDGRFLPGERQRPLLMFAVPWIQQANYRTSLNAAAEILDATVARMGGQRHAIHRFQRSQQKPCHGHHGAGVSRADHPVGLGLAH